MHGRLDIGKLTDPGRTRKHNQDSLGTGEDWDSALLARKGVLILVADGLGREGTGAVASDLAVRIVQYEYYQDPSPDVRQGLTHAIEKANAAIVDQATRNPGYSGMGTTLVAGVVQGTDLFVANVGDSRAYLVRGPNIWQITQDHSWVADQIRAGAMTPEEAQTHPKRRNLSRSLGAAPTVEIDHFYQQLEPGDRILFCTDGLTDLVTDVEIRGIVAQNSSQMASQELIALANQRGGTDNITAVVVAERTLSPARLPLVPIIAGAAAIMLVFLILVLSWGPGPTPPATTVLPPETTTVATLEPTTPAPGPTSTSLTATPAIDATSATATPSVSTASPTDTASPVEEPTTPVPAANLAYEAPILLEPGANSSYTGPDAVIVLAWEEVSDLATNDYYVVTIPYPHDGGTWHEIQWVKDTRLQVPRYLYDLLSGSRECQWYVTVMRHTGTDADGQKTGHAISEPSETRTFVWHLSTEATRSPDQPVPPKATPSPTFEKP